MKWKISSAVVQVRIHWSILETPISAQYISNILCELVLLALLFYLHDSHILLATSLTIVFKLLKIMCKFNEKIACNHAKLCLFALFSIHMTQSMHILALSYAKMSLLGVRRHADLPPAYEWPFLYSPSVS